MAPSPNDEYYPSKRQRKNNELQQKESDITDGTVNASPSSQVNEVDVPDDNDIDETDQDIKERQTAAFTTRLSAFRYSSENPPPFNKQSTPVALRQTLPSDAVRQTRSSSSKNLNSQLTREQPKSTNSSNTRPPGAARGVFTPRLSVTSALLGLQLGSRQRTPYVSLYTSRLSTLQTFKSFNNFNRRVSAMEWHTSPNHPTVIAAASKGGDIAWYQWDKPSAEVGEGIDTSPYIRGQGAGGSIPRLKWHPTDPTRIFSVSVDGTVKCEDFNGRHTQILFNSGSRDVWYTALDVTKSPHTPQIAFANTNGFTTLSSFDGVVSLEWRAHRGKCQDAEYFTPDPTKYLLTAGNDKAARLWDVRMIRPGLRPRDTAVPVAEFPHTGVLNNATFSPLNPHRFLTTSQDDQVRVYDIGLTSSSLCSEFSTSEATPHCVFQHPHRPFQHLTPIQAAWSPVMENVFTIGRYPESNSTDRTIDVVVVDGNEAFIATQIQQRPMGIQSICKFDHSGDVLASCSGFTTFLWKRFEAEPLANMATPQTDTSKAKRPSKGLRKSTERMFGNKKV